MNVEKLKSLCGEKFKALLPMLTEAAGQLFRGDVALKMDISKEGEISSLIMDETFPRIHIQFETVGASPGSSSEETPSGKSRRHLITLTPELALKLYAWMVDSEPDDAVSESHLEGLKEGSNQILGQIQSSVEQEESSFTVEGLTVSLVESAESLDSADLEGEGVRLTYSLTYGKDSYSLEHFVWALASDEEATVEEAEPTMDVVSELSEEDMVSVHPAEFESFSTDSEGNGQAQSVEMLMDVELEVVVELGRKPMLIRDVLKLGKGSVVELDKSAGDALDIFVSQKKLAEGEVVVVDDHFGIRVTQLSSPKERIKNLG